MKEKFNRLEGKIVDRTDAEFDKHIIAWNRAIEANPDFIIYCENSKDVSGAVRVVKKERPVTRIRSGRHHYEGFSTGDDAVIIDLSKMKDIEIDEVKKTVKIGAGVRNKDLYDALNSKGYPFPGGGCPTVGIVGYTLGGGWGYSSRKFGLGCDNLLEVEIVDSSANVITANGSGHTDLFWALRGAGAGNFGVVTSMTFTLLEKLSSDVTLVLFDYKEINKDEKVKVIQTIQKEFKNLDERFNAKVAMYNSALNGTGIYMTGIFYGSKEEAQKVLAPFMIVTDKENLQLREMDIWNANNYIQDSHPDYEHYKSGGRFLYEDLTKEQIEKFVDFVDVRPEGSIYVAVSLYGLGGAVDKYKNEDMAYAHRGANFILGMQSVWEDNKFKEVNSEFVLEMYRYAMEFTKGAYVAFPVKELENYEEEFFGDNLDRVRYAKKEYDLRDIFNYPQGVKVIEQY